MIRMIDVCKKYSLDVTAVDHIHLVVTPGETLVLLGRSGCGKTTTLKMINRLIEADSGDIFVVGTNIKHGDPITLRRNIGYVIQNIGLFPHMTAKENIAVVPELKAWPDVKIKEETLNVLDMVKLPPSILGRYPHELSGGQQQRIGVARAIIANPDIILMDEPFGALDPITREELQDELAVLQLQIKKTIVFVTHDIFEAFRIGDRIGIMDKGKILQIGSPREIVENPLNKFIEKFIGKHFKALLDECSQREEQ